MRSRGASRLQLKHVALEHCPYRNLKKPECNARRPRKANLRMTGAQMVQNSTLLSRRQKIGSRKLSRQSFFSDNKLEKKHGKIKIAHNMTERTREQLCRKDKH